MKNIAGSTAAKTAGIAGKPSTGKAVASKAGARKAGARKAASAARKTATATRASGTAATRKAAAGSPGVAKATAKTAKASKAGARQVSVAAGGDDAAGQGGEVARKIDARIAELGDWRGQVLARVRELVLQADPRIVEEWKWRGVPVWSLEGIICTGETYKDWVKMTFAQGARLDDPTGLFNASLDGNTRRAIDIGEGEKIDGNALKALVRSAVAFNESKKRKPTRAA